jgi:hypothetical protein
MNLSSCCADSLLLMTACFGVILIAVLGILIACGAGDDKKEKEDKKQQDG